MSNERCDKCGEEVLGTFHVCKDAHPVPQEAQGLREAAEKTVWSIEQFTQTRPDGDMGEYLAHLAHLLGCADKLKAALRAPTSSTPEPGLRDEAFFEELREETCSEDDSGTPFYDASLADEIIRKHLIALRSPAPDLALSPEELADMIVCRYVSAAARCTVADYRFAIKILARMRSPAPEAHNDSE